MDASTTAVMFSRASDEWETPAAFYNTLDDTYGFTLDAAASPFNRKTLFHFGPGGLEEDALTADWRQERVFLNPPYSQVKQFMAKAALEAQKGALVVALVPARTDTRWFHDHVYGKAQLTFVKGRLRFGQPGAGVLNSAPFPSLVAVFNGQQRRLK